jgi:hypothetical protein
MTSVFLSSTFIDLTDYREAVQKALRKLGAIDVSMENFGARDERPLQECKRIIQNESDLFVGIYAHRYGYIPDDQEISITESEYDIAGICKKPRFIFIIDENQPVKPSFFDTGKKSDLLGKFKSRVMKEIICDTFTNEDNLATKVVASIGRYLSATKAPVVNAGVPVNDIGFDSAYNPAAEIPNDWTKLRGKIKDENRNIFLTHLIRPSSKPNQKFDVSIYLLRQGSDDFSDVEKAEFFFGKYWGNKIFEAREKDGFIGVATSAYGTFLCICKVTFTDGNSIYLNRYIDFESHRTGGTGF